MSVALVLQDSSTALNTVFTVGDQSIETLLMNGVVPRTGARTRMLELLETVRILDPDRRAGKSIESFERHTPRDRLPGSVIDVTAVRPFRPDHRGDGSLGERT